MIREDVIQALAYVEILNAVRFVPGYKPDYLIWYATRNAFTHLMPTSRKWSLL